jgi:hypothetical protein
MARPRRVRTTDSRHDHPIAPNLLERNFIAGAPNRVWLADITYIETDQGWLYLAAVMDLYSRRIVGWAMQDHLRTELPLTALRKARRQQTVSAEIPIASDPQVPIPSADSSLAGLRTPAPECVRRHMGRHPKTFTGTESCGLANRDIIRSSSIELPAGCGREPINSPMFRSVFSERSSHFGD